MGPEESASSERSGTSGSSRLTFCASGAAMASRPPLTAEKCLRSVLISLMGAPEASSRLVEGTRVFERDLRVERQVEHGRAAAGDEEEDEGIFAGFAEQGERGAGGGEGVFVGHRVTALEVAEAPVALAGHLVGATDAAQALAALHAIEQGVEHGAGGLADGDDEDALVSCQIDDLGAAAVGHEPHQLVSIETHAAVERAADVAGLEALR